MHKGPKQLSGLVFFRRHQQSGVAEWGCGLGEGHEAERLVVNNVGWRVKSIWV